MGGGGGGTLAPPLDLPLNNLCKRNMKDLMKVITWACRPVGITQLCFLLFVLGISSSTCGTLTIFRPQLHTQGVKKFLNYLQNTIQTSNSIFFKKYMNYRNKRTNTKIVNYRTWKVPCLAEKSTRLENWTRLFSSVVPAPQEYHKQKGIDLKENLWAVVTCKCGWG